MGWEKNGHNCDLNQWSITGLNKIISKQIELHHGKYLYICTNHTVMGAIAQIHNEAGLVDMIDWRLLDPGWSWFRVAYMRH